MRHSCRILLPMLIDDGDPETLCVWSAWSCCRPWQLSFTCYNIGTIQSLVSDTSLLPQDLIRSLNYTQIMLIMFNSIFPISNWMWVFVETWKSLRFRVWGLGSFGCRYPNLQVDNSCLSQLVLFDFQCWRKKYGGCCWFCNSLVGLNWSQYCHSTMEWPRL